MALSLDRQQVGWEKLFRHKKAVEQKKKEKKQKDKKNNCCIIKGERQKVARQKPLRSRDTGGKIVDHRVKTQNWKSSRSWGGKNFRGRGERNGLGKEKYIRGEGNSMDLVEGKPNILEGLGEWGKC